MTVAATAEQEILRHLLIGTPIPWATAPQFDLALHTSDPLAADDQSTAEASYPGYARTAIARTALAWSSDGGPITNLVDVIFPQCTAAEEYAGQRIGWISLGIGGRSILTSALLPSVLVTAAGIVRFVPGTITFSIISSA